MSELIFEVTQESDGGFIAEALGENIVTEADSWEQLRANVKEAYYFDEPKPAYLRLHLRKDEVLACFDREGVSVRSLRDLESQPSTTPTR